MNLSNKLNAILKDYSEGNKESAYKKFRKIYLQNNKNIKLRFNLAVMQQELGLLDEAEKNYISLIKNDPNVKYKINLYNLYITKRLFQNALDLINEIQTQNLNLSKVNQDKVYILYLIKNYEDCIIESYKILEVENNNIFILNTLGLCYFHKQNYEKANQTFCQALSLDNNNIEVLNSLGRLCHELRNSKDAELYFNKAYKLNPQTFETLNNIAGFYLEEGEYIKAINFYKQAEALKPKNPVLLNNIAKAYICIDELNYAEEYNRKAIIIDQNNDELKKTLSLILLKKYDFKNAWLYFDGRLGLSDFRSKNSTIDLVKNKIPKKTINKNSKILVLREQGVGDEILYGTMYEDLLKEFSDVTIECDERLLSLFKNSFKKDGSKFVKLGIYSSDPNKVKNFDYIMYAGSLGRFFRGDIKLFPENSYIKSLDNYVDIELENILKKSNGIKIGISWKSFKNRYSREKSLSLDDFIDIFELKKSTFFNLQYGDVKDELDQFIKKKKFTIISLRDLDIFNNLTGLANLLSKLDIFITVSNSTAHLAGALGVKTLLIKPDNHASFHYWNYTNGNTPWYKSIKIISKKDLKDKELIKKFFKT